MRPYSCKALRAHWYPVTNTYTHLPRLSLLQLLSFQFIAAIHRYAAARRCSTYRLPGSWAVPAGFLSSAPEPEPCYDIK